jgi:branched-chain amino acid transport system substrate-binding protein
MSEYAQRFAESRIDGSLLPAIWWILPTSPSGSTRRIALGVGRHHNGGTDTFQQREHLIAACVAGALLALATPPARAQAPSREPIKIGYGISQTGGLAPNGKSALLAHKIWAEDVNAKGGLLGRPVKLVYYDDQTNPATVPGIYQKLLDVDKVDIVIGGYGSNLLAPAMPVVIQNKKMLIGLLGMAVNTEFNYPNYFSMVPLGPTPKSAMTKGFFEAAMAQNPKPRTVAIVGADAEYPISGSEGARENARAAGLKVVYDKRYPPATADFAPIVRAIRAAEPDVVAIFSYPPDSVGMVRAVHENWLQPQDDRWRHGRTAGECDQGATWPAA